MLVSVAEFTVFKAEDTSSGQGEEATSALRQCSFLDGGTAGSFQ